MKWCLNKKDGIEFVEPNQNRASSYINMAQESIKELDNVKSSIWKATITYYGFYYSLYALMMRIGVKCEIHSCSLEFMKQLLGDFYSDKDIEMINKAFSARIDLQYYANRSVDAKAIEQAKSYCRGFFIKTNDIMADILDSQIKSIRNKLKEYK